MQYRYTKAQNASLHRYPFVCHFVPFICLNNPSTYPFIGKKIPFVWNQGITLIELIITLTIAGILMAFAAPSLRNFVDSNRQTSQVNDLIADISFARSEAIKRNGTVVICKSADPLASTPTCDQIASNPWETGRLVFVDANSDNKFVASDNDSLLRVRDLFEGNNTLRPNSPSVSPNLSNYLAYSKSGLTTLATPTAADGPHRFKVCNSRGRVRGVILETTGRTQLVAEGNTTFTWSGTTYTLTCP